MDIKIATWNINTGKNLGKVIDYVREIDPDILCLQEVVEGHRIANGENIARVIANNFPERGYQVVWFPAFKTDRHIPSYEYGNAILSKYPIQDAIRHELSGLDKYKKTRETEPRIAIEAKINVAGKILRVFNTHLAVSGDFGPFDLRHLQIDNLCKMIQSDSKEKVEETLVLGDFDASNDPYTMKRISSILHNADNDSTQGTWPVFIESATHHKERSELGGVEFGLLSQRLDHIFRSQDLTVGKFEIGRTDASDHLPLIANIRI